MGTTTDKLNKLLETKAAIKKAIIDKGVEVGEDVVFADYPNKIVEISGPDYISLRTSNHTNYKALFYGYLGDSLESFGLNTWNTSNVTDMEYMFAFCKGITKLDLNSFDTSKVTDMGYMFIFCSSLISLNLSNWNTSNVTDMGQMFNGCRNLESLNLSNFNMSNANPIYTFQNCNKLHTLRLDNCEEDTIRKIIESNEFPTGLVWNDKEGTEVTRKMWVSPKYAADLTAPDGWEFVDCFTGEVIAPEEEIPLYQPDMFRGNIDIEEVSVMVTKEHDNLSDMFSECENLKTINGINEWDTSNVTTMNNMFYSCRSLESLDLSSFNTSNVTNMFDMFSECENLKELNISNFEVREDCDTDWMLNNCRRLHTLRLDNCNEDTIRKIIESNEFPTGGAEDYEGTRTIYCLEKNVANLTAPDGWEFVYVK